VQEFVRRLTASDERILEHLQSLEMPVPHVWEFLRRLGKRPGLGGQIEESVLGSLLRGLAGGTAPAAPASVGENPPKAPPKLPTRPPDKAFQAWQVRELVGISKQGEIARIMTERGIPATQGQVSKWLAAVEEWRLAGGLMPEVSTREGKPQSVDPDILDMGARQDGLTPRQRPRRDSDADE